MLEVAITIMAAVILSLLVGVVGYLYFKLRKYTFILDQLAGITKTQVADFASEGGMASVAKRQSDMMLATILKRVIGSQGGGIGDMILDFIPELTDWVQSKPYGVASLLTNPAFQKLAKAATQFLGNGEKFQPVTQLPQQQTMMY